MTGVSTGRTTDKCSEAIAWHQEREAEMEANLHRARALVERLGELLHEEAECDGITNPADCMEWRQRAADAFVQARAWLGAGEGTRRAE